MLLYIDWSYEKQIYVKSYYILIDLMKKQMYVYTMIFFLQIYNYK